MNSTSSRFGRALSHGPTCVLGEGLVVRLVSIIGIIGFVGLLRPTPQDDAA